MLLAAYYCILLHTTAYYCIILHTTAYYCMLLHTAYCILHTAYYILLLHAAAAYHCRFGHRYICQKFSGGSRGRGVGAPRAAKDVANSYYLLLTTYY